MSRIRGKYIAQIIIMFDLERVPGMNSLSEIQMQVRDGEFANAIKEEITELSEGKVTVIDLYSNLYEVNDDGTV